MNIKLPILYDKQRDIKQNLELFNVINCGRRTGKTTLAVDIAINSMINKEFVSYCTPTYQMSSKVWEEIISICAPIIAKTDKTLKYVKLVTGGSLDMWSMNTVSANSMRGNKYHLQILDEAAYMPSLHMNYENIISPTLLDYNGRTILFSTPYGYNDFKIFADKAQKNKDSAYFHLTTYNNPYINKDQIDKLKTEMTSLRFRQEILAEFVQEEGAVIKREWLKYTDNIPKDNLVMAADLAISQKEGSDYTAICVMHKKDNGDIIIVDVIRDRLPFNSQLQLIHSIANKYNVRQVGIEKVAYQAAAIQELLRTTELNIKEIVPDRDKVTRFQPLAARYEQGLVYHNRNLSQVFENELLSFPEGEHDDMIDACSYAYQMLNKGGVRIWDGF